MERGELAAWLRLLETPGIGREAGRRLLAAFGSPERVLSATLAARSEVVSADCARALDTEPDHVADLVDTTLQWLVGAEAVARHVIVIGDPLYPELLLQAPDPPLLLYVAGDAALLSRPGIGMVGSRNPTPQGKENARQFAIELAQAGWSVVSGLALGIDGAAHEGALDANGHTVAVVGTGLDRVYPRRHLELARRIVATGAIVSEFPIGTPPLAGNFPQRNRIIAGLTSGTLVIEAALQSGSLITARLASESGREVFAVPGSIRSVQSRGCHALIKQGAKLVENTADVLDELPALTSGLLPAPHHTDASEDEPQLDPVLDAMGYDPVSLDALVARTGWSAPQLNARLLEFELLGQVARLPGQLFQRVSTG
jgi:DNA processing protein